MVRSLNARIKRRKVFAIKTEQTALKTLDFGPLERRGHDARFAASEGCGRMLGDRSFSKPDSITDKTMELQPPKDQSYM